MKKNTAVAGLFISVLSGALFFGLSMLNAGPPPSRVGESSTALTGGEMPTWKDVHSLIADQKYQSALEAVLRLRDHFRESGDAAQWTRAQIETTKLRIALSGYETAVNELLQAPTPVDPENRDLLGLYSAHALVEYARNYQWEIRQRERVISDEEIDLKRWTMDQILTEAHRRFAAIWKDREAWGDRGLGDFAPYFEQNDYPKGIRDTLRDTITYLWIELLKDSSYWKPGQSDHVYQLGLQALADGSVKLSEAQLTEAEVHPLLRLSYISGDLESWHRSHGRPEAALEARMERLQVLDAHVTTNEDHALLRENLGHVLLRMDSSDPWWSMGMAKLADMVRDDPEDPEALVRARSIAEEGLEAHATGPGAAACRAVISSIESTQYSLQAMASDSLDKNSIRVNYRNMDTLYFRAYPFDLEEMIRESKDSNLLPGYRELPEYLHHHRAVAEWKMDLPKTPDFRNHDAYSIPDLPSKGTYVIISSRREDFSEEADNDFRAICFFASDLVLIREEVDGIWEVTARDGRTGEALKGVELQLWESNWRKGHQLKQRILTQADGRAKFQIPARASSHFLVGRRMQDLALIRQLPYIRPEEASTQDRVFLYTDRSVYRPEQEIFFKVVAFSGGSEDSVYHTRSLQPLKITLHDANNDEVAAVDLKTNDFGSASGSFKIPGGRMLGTWMIHSSFGPGSTSIQVEEYKRPTFEVTIDDPDSPLRLNREAVLSGEARYYFGLPVAEGKITWRVTREPVYPRWWWWPRPSSQPEVIAAGETSLDASGKFNVHFTPAANEALAEKGLSYRFRLSADAVEPGGETRSATRVFRLGFSAVEAHLDTSSIYLPAGLPQDLNIVRTDLDGIPRAGEAQWKLLRIRQAVTTLMPAEEKVPEPENPRSYQTPGDRIRPRWESAYNPEEILRSWETGEEIASGLLHHADNGTTSLQLPALKPGPYRLIYETQDNFGTTFKLQRQFIAGSLKSPPLKLAAVLEPESSTISVGGTARLFLASGLPHQELLLELFHGGQRFQRRVLDSDSGPQILEIPIGPELRGGFSAALSLLRDHQHIRLQQSIFVPWDDRKLKLEFSTFRDRLHPGESEKFRIRVTSADGKNLAPKTAEILAYMYDRSLDIFAPHLPPDISSLYPRLTGAAGTWTTLGLAPLIWQTSVGHDRGLLRPHFRGDRLKTLDSYGIGGPGRRGPLLYKMRAALPSSAAPPEAMMEDSIAVEPEAAQDVDTLDVASTPGPEGQGEEPELRSDFAETAFFLPSITLDGSSSAMIEFTAPESVTEWNLWVHALTRDLRGVSKKRQLSTVKELMVRPAVPRFFREGDAATLLITINNAGKSTLEGALRLKLQDPETGEDLRNAFGMDLEATSATKFSVDPNQGLTLPFPLHVPPRPGMVVFEVSATAGDFSDGERRPLPILPGRMHLMQSRFAALHDSEHRELVFDDMKTGDDPSRINEQLVVSLDAQLFYSVLNALPYLIDYPYECTEQTLNRFLSTGIVSSVFSEFPAVADMARKMAERDTRLESWDQEDPNRKLALEETPWLVESQGGRKENLIRILDPKVAEAQQRSSLGKLEKMQTSSGAFPWWPGGPPSPWMTLYVLAGFSHAMEFGVDVPKSVVSRAWTYMHRHYLDTFVRDMQKENCCWESITWLNFILSSYPDENWAGGVFSPEERRKMLNFSFAHWKKHSPRLKAYLALTLNRMGRREDALLVWDSVMDSLKVDPDLGAFWAREDRSWLWYNDTTETHAMALRTLTELSPEDPRRQGLIQWIFLNKKLNHWKSTRATAEVIYAIVHYLRNEGRLGTTERISVKAGPLHREFVFTPDEYTGNNAQLVIPGDQIRPETMSTIVVEKTTPGLAFATASWHFSTEKLPDHGDGDLLSVERRLYRRSLKKGEWVLTPLDSGDSLSVGDQVEIELRIRARHAAEYVHLRDPRGAGFEPESLHSGYRWDLGIGTYEEIRDSGENFFFEWLPAGEYTFRYRIRATMAGRFRLAPAVLQSMYAPEFGAYSAGQILEVEP